MNDYTPISSIGGPQLIESTQDHDVVLLALVALADTTTKITDSDPKIGH